MRISRLGCDEETELHILLRHHVAVYEVEEAVGGRSLTVRGRAPRIYEVYGSTEAGRHLLTVIRYVGKGEARLITAREMTQTERRRYRRQIAH